MSALDNDNAYVNLHTNDGIAPTNVHPANGDSSPAHPGLTEELGKYVRNPSVKVSTTIRLAVLGSVNKQGFYQIAADMRAAIERRGCIRESSGTGSWSRNVRSNRFRASGDLPLSNSATAWW